MFRHTSFVLITLISITFGSTALAAQSKPSAETVLSRCWQFPAENITGLIASSGQIVATVQGGRVFSLSATGDKLWETDLGGEFEPAISTAGGQVVVATRSGAGVPVLRRLSIQTGLPVNSSTEIGASAPPAMGPDPSSTTSVEGMEILGDDHGRVTALTVEGNDPVWTFKTGGAVSAVLAVDDGVIVISRDNFVYSLNAKKGGLRWKRRLQGRVTYFATYGGYLLVTSVEQHGASLIDTASGRVVGKVVLGSDEDLLTAPVVVSDGFVLATEAGISEYSLSRCSFQNESGPVTSVPNRSQKQF